MCVPCLLVVSELIKATTIFFLFDIENNQVALAPEDEEIADDEIATIGRTLVLLTRSRCPMKVAICFP